MDLVIVFVKSMFTRAALETNRNLIGPDTYLMTLQNGAGHEKQLLEFVDREHVIIGSTQHNSSILADGYVNHGGGAGHLSDFWPAAAIVCMRYQIRLQPVVLTVLFRTEYSTRFGISCF